MKKKEKKNKRLQRNVQSSPEVTHFLGRLLPHWITFAKLKREGMQNAAVTCVGWGCRKGKRKDENHDEATRKYL